MPDLYLLEQQWAFEINDLNKMMDEIYERRIPAVYVKFLLIRVIGSDVASSLKAIEQRLGVHYAECVLLTAATFEEERDWAEEKYQGVDFVREGQLVPEFREALVNIRKHLGPETVARWRAEDFTDLNKREPVSRLAKRMKRDRECNQ